MRLGVPHDAASLSALADAATALLIHEDPLASEIAARKLLATDVADWARWIVLGAALMGERIGDGLSIIAEPSDAPWTEVVHWGPTDNEGWGRSGTGSIAVTGDAARFVDLGGSGVRHIIPVPSTNSSGALVEFIARRGSGVDGDCRLEVSDGTVREAVQIDTGCVRLLNGSGFVPLNTSRPHHYALWLRGQRSTLYVDGQPALEANGLEADHRASITFGVFAVGSGADTESHWWRVRLVVPQGIERVPVVPKPWPTAIWERLIASAGEEGRPSDMLSLTVRARLSQPDDPRSEALMLARFDEAAQRDELRSVFHRSLEQLTLRDRSLVIARSVGTRDVLIVARNIGITFEHSASSGSIRTFVRGLRTGSPARTSERFWAVRDVSFELRAGEMLAIIGRNGAGKSTLLRLIADLLKPEAGELVVSGKRILLSLGGSFLPDLTGRDNIFLAGLYLGMTKREIAVQFDEIVEFAELWDAIDRPLRTYSTGMQSRLQFALATTVSPEILMLDELLGAGDASFVEKAETRMNRLLRRAKGVIVVTHNLAFVQRTCTQAILLERGEVLFRGSPERAVVAYRDLLERRPKRAEREAASVSLVP